MMRIGIDVLPLQTGTRFAGVGCYLKNLIASLSQLDTGNDYVLVVNDSDYLEEVSPPSLQWQKISLIRRHRLGRFWSWWDTVYLPIVFIRQGLDLYHYNSLSEREKLFPPVPFGPHRVVATIHDVIPLVCPEVLTGNVDQRQWHREYKKKFQRLRHADAIMTVSECSKRDIMAYLNYPEERIFVTYNGIAPEFFQKPPPEALAGLTRKYDLPEAFVLYLGGYYSLRKNIDRLLNAYALLHKQQKSSCPPLVLAGLSNADHQAGIQTMLDQKGLPEYVLCLPHIPDDELPVLYRLATLFVYPTLYEGFGLPVAEALACGTVVVTSDCSSLPEIGGESCLYCDPYDPQSIAEMLYEGLTNTETRKILQQKGPEQVARFSWHHTARSVMSVYQQVYEA